MEELCKANTTFGSNYGKPHVWVEGVYDGKPRRGCLYCGQWEETDDDVRELKTLKGGQ